MELTNKREVYSFMNNNETIKLSGEVTVDTQGMSLHGGFSLLEGTPIGYVTYRENGTLLDQSFSGLGQDYAEAVLALFKATIAELKTTLVL